MPTSDGQGSGGAAGLPPDGRDQFRIDLMLALKARREGAGLTRAELGTLAGLGVSYVGMMEAGRINPRVSTVLKLVKILDARYERNRDEVDALRDLTQFVDDLRGWIRSTSETLKRSWIASAASPNKAGRSRAAHARLRTDVMESADERRPHVPEESG